MAFESVRRIDPLSLPSDYCCSLCNLPYSNELNRLSDRSPLLLFCGHTFCATCLHHLKTRSSSCPSCSVLICWDNLNTNYALIQLMNQNNYFKNDLIQPNKNNNNNNNQNNFSPDKLNHPIDINSEAEAEAVSDAAIISTGRLNLIPLSLLDDKHLIQFHSFYLNLLSDQRVKEVAWQWGAGSGPGSGPGSGDGSALASHLGLALDSSGVHKPLTFVNDSNNSSNHNDNNLFFAIKLKSSNDNHYDNIFTHNNNANLYKPLVTVSLIPFLNKPKTKPKFYSRPRAGAGSPDESKDFSLSFSSSSEEEYEEEDYFDNQSNRFIKKKIQKFRPSDSKNFIFTSMQNEELFVFLSIHPFIYTPPHFHHKNKNKNNSYNSGTRPLSMNNNINNDTSSPFIGIIGLGNPRSLKVNESNSLNSESCKQIFFAFHHDYRGFSFATESVFSLVYFIRRFQFYLNKIKFLAAAVAVEDQKNDNDRDDIILLASKKVLTNNDFFIFGLKEEKQKMWGDAVDHYRLNLSKIFRPHDSSPVTFDGEGLDSIIFFNCPHCGMDGIINYQDINCGIFRHAVYKSNGLSINPHGSKKECKRLIQSGLVFGCAKPLRLIHDRIHVCGWI